MSRSPLENEGLIIRAKMKTKTHNPSTLLPISSQFSSSQRKITLISEEESLETKGWKNIIPAPKY